VVAGDCKLISCGLSFGDDFALAMGMNSEQLGPTPSISEEHAQDGCGIKRSSERANGFLSSVAARSRSLSAIREPNSSNGVQRQHKAPNGVVRPVVGPHSPLYGVPRASHPLVYLLKMIDPASRSVVSVTRVSGPQEALAALRLLGPTNIQAVLVSRAIIEFLPRV
jgi:hypothetical protein